MPERHTPRLHEIHAVDLPDGGFLILDGIRMVRVEYADRSYDVVVTKEDGQRLTVASWYTGFGPLYLGSPMTDEQKERHAEVVAIHHEVNAVQKQRAEEWAGELRWIVETTAAGRHKHALGDLAGLEGDGAIVLRRQDGRWTVDPGELF